MSQKPILPARLAQDTLEELRGFVSVMLYVRNVSTREAIKKCLFDDDPIVKGPFFQLRQPFASASHSEWPLDQRLKDEKRSPYAHQLAAYKRLRHSTARNTLVTTGTGSGKSECFQLPILDYVLWCKENGKVKGVKALILYPMNALIDDQAGRFSELANKLNASLPENRQIRVGRYTGGGGKCKQHDPSLPKQIIDHRDALCAEPPDILLTNYRMLDFMLYRPEEQSFWASATKEAFRYLVLDEVHTYDGAQGADVACLLRRLRLKLGNEYTVVGTSATIQGDAKNDISGFVSTLTGSKFDDSSIITETRLESGYLQPKKGAISGPKVPLETIDLLSAGPGKYEDYLKSACVRWQAPSEPLQLGTWLIEHPLTNLLVEKSRLFSDLSDTAGEVGLSEEDLTQFLDLIAYAKRKENNEFRPVLNLQTQLWVQEVKMVLRRLGKTPYFVRPNTFETQSDPDNIYLPAANCKECGASAWVALLDGDSLSANGLSIETDTRLIQSAFYEQRAHLLFECSASQGKQNLVGTFYYDSSARKLYTNEGDQPDTRFPVILRLQRDADFGILPTKKRDAKKERPEYCPECEAKVALQLTSFGSSMLGSVLSSAFVAHGGNPEDKKILFFNDSIQDASHQAGYLSSRSYRFNVRRNLYQIATTLAAAEKSITWSALNKEMSRCVTELFERNVEYRRTEAGAPDKVPAQGREALRSLLAFIPQDLWERWEAIDLDPFSHVDQSSKELIDRVKWEFVLELGQNSSIGWSLRKSGLICFDPGKEMFETWRDALALACSEKGAFKSFHSHDSFIYGLLRRFVTRGAIDLDDLRPFYEKVNFSLWGLRITKPHLTAIFSSGGQRPTLLSMEYRANAEEKRRGIEYILPAANKSNWYRRWLAKHGVDDVELYLRLFQHLDKRTTSGLIRAGREFASRYVIDPDSYGIKLGNTTLFRCDHCSNLEAIGPDYHPSDLKCTQNTCEGKMFAHKDEAEDFRRYMQRQYGRAIVPLYGHAHTGQLEVDDRRKIESAFKDSLLPGDRIPDGSRKLRIYNEHPVNVLSCTPTLEMGIDIGDLSGVTLRSFPRALANIQQRLGRAGRRTGMAFNSILAKIRPHDQHYWAHPDEVLRGTVKTPGCSFRNHQMLFRQFNAYCLDFFAGHHPDLSIPTLSEHPEIAYEDEPYWVAVLTFLKDTAVTLIPSFVDETMKDCDTKSGTDLTKSTLQTFLETAHQDQRFRIGLERVLKRLTASRALLTEERKSEPPPTDLPPKNGENATEETAADIGKESSKQSANQAWRSLADMDYVFKLLGDQGLLPNYAFLEDGVRLRASIWIPQSERDRKKDNKPFRFKQSTISRPPRLGLSELAPGQTYYIDGYKVPVLRINRSYAINKEAEANTVCEYCGNITKIAHRDPITAAACGNCGQPARVIPLIYYQEVEGYSHFGDAQIRDQDEERERKPMVVDVFVNRISDDIPDSKQMSWISTEDRLAIEFRTNTKIHFLNRGERIDADQHSLFALCPECWAIPDIQKRQGGKIEYLFENRKGDGINRHHFACKHRSNPNNPEILPLKAAILRTIVSDAILVRADTQDDLPTLKAVLSLMVNLYLKGNPGHIRISELELQPPDRSHQYIALIYDDVPGGSGHLRSLMKFTESGDFNDSDGLSRIGRILNETKEVLEECPCENGCYKCLYRFENQFEHALISKARALTWLSGFSSAKDWSANISSLTVELLQNPAFDSYTEQRFIEGLTDRTSPGIVGVSEIQQKIIDGDLLYELMDQSKKLSLIVRHAPKEKIPLGKGYTKPDFHLFRPGEPKPAAYLYVDGAAVHVEVDKEVPTLYQDLDLRERLQTEHKVPVLTFTYDMIDAWIRLRAGNNISTKTTANLNRLLHSLMGLFAPDKFPQLQNTVEIDGLFCAFISHQIGRIAGTSSGLIEDGELDEFSKAVSKYLAPNREFGGLVWNGKVFELKTDLFSRTGGGEQNKKSFLNAWAMFWMIWQVNPELVQLSESPKGSATKRKSKLAS